MDSQSRRIVKVGSSYLDEIGSDFGGRKAAEIGQNAAKRYLAQVESANGQNRPKPYAIGGAIGLTAVALATNLGGARDALISILQQF